MLPDGFTPEFVEALRLIGSAMEEVRAAGRQCPILVGGAALQLWTTGRYVSGDFDLVDADPTPMETALIARGFRREDRPGHLLRGLYHPELDLGVEFPAADCSMAMPTQSACALSRSVQVHVCW